MSNEKITAIALSLFFLIIFCGILGIFGVISSQMFGGMALLPILALVGLYHYATRRKVSKLWKEAEKERKNIKPKPLAKNKEKGRFERIAI